MSSFQPNIPNILSGIPHVLPSRKREEYIRQVRQRILHGILILALALAVAVPAGIIGAFFRLSVSWANHFRILHPDMIWFLPVGGLLIAAIYSFCRIGHRNELQSVTRSIQSAEETAKSETGSAQEYVSGWLAPVVYSASVLSHLCGASAGCEGASIILGGGVGAQAARWFRLTGRDYALVVFCAMASAFSPLLGTPLAASVFVLERCRHYRWQLIFPCLAASFIAFGLAETAGVEPLRFSLITPVQTLPAASFRTLGSVTLLVFACIAAGYAFQGTLTAVTRLCDRFLPNRFFAMAVGGSAILGMTLLLGTQSYSGTGISGITAALHGSAGDWAFFWKIFFTSLALGFGFKGGQIVPAFFVGAVLGCALAPSLGLSPAFAAALGLIALFAVVVRCPVTAFLLALEIFQMIAAFWFFYAVLLCVTGTFFMNHMWKTVPGFSLKRYGF